MAEKKLTTNEKKLLVSKALNGEITKEEFLRRTQGMIEDTFEIIMHLNAEAIKKHEEEKRMRRPKRGEIYYNITLDLSKT